MPKKTSPETQSLPDPLRFNLASFAELLPSRDPIVGEDPGTFDGFRAGLFQSLGPATPYECVIAENLVLIEWELLQHRAMREACLLRSIRPAIAKAVRGQMRREHLQAMDEAWDEYVEQGGAEDDWEEPYKFDAEAADEAASKLVDQATSRDPQVQAAAYAEISQLGLSPLELLSEAYRGTLGESFQTDQSAEYHDAKIRELERRRREVKRDFDQLQQSRPDKGVIIEQ